MVIRRQLLVAIAASTVALGVLNAGPALAAPACTLNWTGGGGNSNWSTPANWDLLRPPTSTDVVCVEAGVGTPPIVDTAYTVRSVQAHSAVTVNAALTITDTADDTTFTSVGLDSGGALSDAGTVDISGTMVWQGGELSGPGGTTHLLASSTLSATGGVQSNTMTVRSGHALQTDGTGSETGGAIALENGVTWTNAGTFDLIDSGGVNSSPTGTGATGVLHNTGSLTKSGGPMQVTINIPLRNDGTVSAATGTLTFHQGSGVSTGNFGGSGPGTTQLTGAFSLGNGATFDHLQVSGFADVEVVGGATASGQNLEYDGTNIIPVSKLGGPGHLIVSGTLLWNGGYLSGVGGTLTVLATGALNIQPGACCASGKGIFDQYTLDTHGPVTLGAPISVYQTSVWRNAGSMTLSGTSPSLNGSVQNPAEPAAELDNSGAITVAAGATNPAFGLTVHNTGTISAAGPPLAMIGAVLDSGAISNATFSDTLELGGGATLGSATLIGATVTVDGGAEASSTATTIGGSQCCVTTIAGNGTLDLLGTTTWEDGAMSGDGATVVPAGATLNLAPSGFHDSSLHGSRLLETDGTTNLPGFSAVFMHDRALWINTGTVTLDQGGIRSVQASFGAPVSTELFNTGTITRTTANAGTVDELTNDGTLSIPVGQISVGTLTETANGKISIGIAGTTAQSTYGVLALPGTSQVSATPNLAGTLAITVDPSFQPADGSTYSVIALGGARNGDFDTVTVSPLAGGTLTEGWMSSAYEITAHQAAAKMMALIHAAAPTSATPVTTTIHTPIVSSIRDPRATWAPVVHRHQARRPTTRTRRVRPPIRVPTRRATPRHRVSGARAW